MNLLRKFTVEMEWAGGSLTLPVETDEGWLFAQCYAMTVAVREHGAKTFTKAEVREAL
jgi:hypothetical protein